MEQSKIERFITSMEGKFPSKKLDLARKQLLQLDDSKLNIIESVDYKEPTTLLIISLFLGWAGIDRLMLGNVGGFIIKPLILAFGIFLGFEGVWFFTLLGVILVITDWFTIIDITKKENYIKFSEICYENGVTVYENKDAIRKEEGADYILFWLILIFCCFLIYAIVNYFSTK